LGRKRRKAEHFSSTPSTNQHGAKEFSPPKRKKIKSTGSSAQVQVTTIQPRKLAQKSPSLSVDLVNAKPKGMSALEKLVEPHGIPAYSQKDRDEDAYEAYLEAKLGYGKVDKRKIYSQDGLDGMSAFNFSSNISIVQIYSTWLLHLFLRWIILFPSRNHASTAQTMECSTRKSRNGKALEPRPMTSRTHQNYRYRCHLHNLRNFQKVCIAGFSSHILRH
jgi:hypothetical protein